MYRTLITITLVTVVFIAGVFAVWALNGPDRFSENDNDEEIGEENAEHETPSETFSMEEFVLCLKEEGVIIYGSVTCPFCHQLAQMFGGYDVIDPIYVECSEDHERCMEEMQTNGVPEIQIKGELYQGGRSPEEIGRAVGCEFDG